MALEGGLKERAENFWIIIMIFFFLICCVVLFLPSDLHMSPLIKNDVGSINSIDSHMATYTNVS